MKALSEIKRDKDYDQNNYNLGNVFFFEFISSEDPWSELYKESLLLAGSSPSAHTPDQPYRGSAYCKSGNIEELENIRNRLLTKDWTNMTEDDELFPKS
jgi:hypothetical protein